MLKSQFFVSIICLNLCLAFSPLMSEAPVCHHCEEIRLYNAAHHKNYEYFEDYKGEDEGKANPVAETTDKPKASKNVAQSDVKPK